MIQRLINKYGEELGKIKYQEWKEKAKINNAQKNNPRYRNDITQSIVLKLKNDGLTNMQIAKLLKCGRGLIIDILHNRRK